MEDTTNDEATVAIGDGFPLPSSFLDQRYHYSTVLVSFLLAFVV